MQTPIQAILSNCRIFLDRQSENIKTFHAASEKQNKDIESLREEITDIDAFYITKVMSVALANKDFLPMLLTCEQPEYQKVDDAIYLMACRNCAYQIRQDKELRQQALRLRSKKRIQEIEEQIVGLNAFQMSQILSIAFLKSPEQIVLDIVKEQDNLIEEF